MVTMPAGQLAQLVRNRRTLGLQTATVVDYENVHLAGHGLFASTRLQLTHHTD
ncbi:MAG: hypothetical protein J0I11_10605 [Actinobacteria bacterium]|jgi:CHAT domain-containing protein|nr:hypothetical protein [Actinomycetota bacterium]